MSYPNGIFETLDWLKRQDKKLCCRIDKVEEELSAEIATKITNIFGVPSFEANPLASLPTPGTAGRMYISTDTFAFYRDNGTGWDLIGGPGIGTVTGSGVATQVAFWNGTSVVSGSSNLYWDNVNSRLGIGTAAPAYSLDVSGTLRSTGLTYLGTGGNDVGINTVSPSTFLGGTKGLAINFSGVSNGLAMSAGGSNNIIHVMTSGGQFYWYAGGLGNRAGTIFTGTGNWLLGTSSTDAGYKLDVNGTARVSSGNTTTSLQVDVTAANTYNNVARFYGPNINTGTYSFISVGRNNNTNNDAGMLFYYAGNGSTNNRLEFTFNGNVNSPLTIRADGNVGIGTSSPNTSALLDVSSTTKGFLPPRQTQAQRTAIASPAVGLVVYQTDGTEGLYVNTSTGWKSLTMV